MAPRALLLAAGALLAGCGNAQTPAPDVEVPGPPLTAVPASFPQAGLRFQSPGGWRVTPGQAPLVATVTTGTASIAIFRYPRTEPLPRTVGQRAEALDALTAAAKQRDATWTESRRSTFDVDHRPAVVLRGTETIAGQPRTVRSTHVYADGAEVVVDAFAPATDFVRVDRDAFRPLVRSLRLGRPAA